MKNRLPVIIAILLIALPATGFADEYFVIDHYQINMDVIENNSYNITEVIDVNFNTRRHGIYRVLPLKFDKMPVEISNIDVPGFQSGIEKNRDELTIRIGSADTYVNGSVKYTISYTYDVGADNLSDMDEFNCNLVGLDWDTTIAAADFVINMPKPFKASDVNCTSGPYGSTDNSNVAWQVNGTTITGKLKKPIGNHEGLTVALPLPEGYWVGAERHREQGWLFNMITGYPLYILVIVLAFILWYTKGRDNKLFPSVEFEPPEGLNPSEIGYIIDGSVDSKDVTSLILYWADKGYIEIEEEGTGKGLRKKKKLTLIKTGEPGADAKTYEKQVFKKLFSYGQDDRVSTEDLANIFYTTVRQAQLDIKKSFTDNPEKAIFKKGSGGYTFLAGVLAALPVITILARAFAPMEGKGPLWLLGIPFSLFLIIPALMLGSAITGQSSGSKGSIVFASLFGGFSIIFFGVFTVISAGIPVYRYLAAVGSCIIVCIFVSIMSRRTEYGDKILEKVLGFKEFIKTAEKDKLEMMFEQNPQYFYNILPYAMVLGLSDKWASHFDALTVEPPRWYRGYNYPRFSTAAFTRNLNSSFTQLNSSMSSAPSSSGSSGSSSSGGFSGGGSGGGGGGSW